jgi:hypothetical protein
MHMTWGALRLRELWEGNNGGSTVIRVETDSSGASPDGFPTHEVLRYHIPARGSMPPAVIQWYHSSDEKLTEMGLWNRLEGLAGRSLDWGQGWASRSGSLLVGSEGVVHTNPHNSLCALLPMENFPNQEGPPQRISRAGSHEREWVAGCLGGPKPFSNFDYAGPVIELLLLGNVCTLVGRPIEYDPVAGVIVDDDEANRALHPPRRDGWAL